ncbi:MAG: alpha/beta fold hydrolase [Verrucomicrobiales bacterium]|nr:alpha/beta fold hydrolase [Verrucomicrobiales bacterium]
MIHPRHLFHLLALLSLLFFSACTQYSKVYKRPIFRVASTSEQKSLYRKAQSKDPLARIGSYLDTANSARLKLLADHNDSQAQSDYNFAVARIVEVIEAEGYSPWEQALTCPAATGKPWQLSLKPPDPRPEYHPSNFHILPTDRFAFKGKLINKAHLVEGMGAPVTVIGNDLDFTKFDPFAQGKSIYYGFTTIIRFKNKKCVIEVIDPLEQDQVAFDGHRYQVASDFQAPLALAMAESHPKKMGRGMMFKPTQHLSQARLARLQVYNPNKIPVILIHGLGDSPAIWAPMVDYLRSDTEIRKRYQFWVFGYPSGLPYPLPAAILRKQLDLMKQRYPNHKDVIIVGHSLGGNITRLLISDSGMEIWNTYFDKAPDKMPFSDTTRQALSDMLIFKARPDVSRVIFASASLRGSEKAVNFWGRLGAKLIGNPITMDRLNKEAIANARPEFRQGRKHLPNSVHILDPGTTFLKVANNLPLSDKIPYHSIIGDRGKGGNLDHTPPVSTDGIVPYWSSHLDGAQSELIIPSEHWSILHPQAKAEVRRILLQHTD